MDVKLDTENFVKEWDTLRSKLAQTMEKQSGLGLPSEGLEAIYHKAHGAFAAENYELAENLFLLLRTMEPGETRFQIGLAAASEAQEKYDVALTHYSMAMACGEQTPGLLYRAGKCLLGMENREEARAFFTMAGSAAHGGVPGEIIAVEKAKKWMVLLTD
ncbi:MAG: hypothetical protein MI747_03600 [Desulfobacterales bacterium]|nr:hypothetical protein [Desulfobacterales bacterium]